MRGQQNSPALSAKRFDHIPQLPSRLRIEPRGWLIEEQKIRIAHQCAGEREPLLLSAGKSTHARVSLLAELHHVDHLGRCGTLIVKAAEQPHRLEDRQLLGKLCILQLNAETLPQRHSLGLPLHSEHAHVTRIRGSQPLADLDCRRLARAIGAQQPEAFTPLHLKVKTVHGHDVTIGFAQTAHLEGGHSAIIASCPDRRGLSSETPVRKALSILIVLLAFFAADSLLFRAGWYNAYLEPDSSAGSLEAQLHWLRDSPVHHPPEVLVIGDSRIAEGFSSPIAGLTTGQALRFWNFGLGGTTPRVWYYTLRAADPTRRRFQSIVIALDKYPDRDWFAEFEDRISDQNYIVMRLGLSDCFDFASSMHTSEIRQRALFGCLFRGIVLRNDVQTFLSHPEARLTHAADWRQNGLGYSDGYGGKTENLRGLSVDWSHRTIHFPDGVSEATRANVMRFVLPEPAENRGALARYRQRWLGGILDLYKDSPTHLIFLQLPRAPLVDPEARAGKGFVDSLTLSPHIQVLPAPTFVDLERPEFFADGLHLNRNGRAVFSERLAALVEGGR